MPSGVLVHHRRWLSNQLQCLPRDQPWSAQLGHHTGPDAHASQGDTVEPAFQAVAMVVALLSRARPPVEDGLVVVEQL